MPLRPQNNEVLFADGQIVKLSRQDIRSLKEKARRNRRRRVRLCAHRDVRDALHEMFIVHQQGNYIRPHKHLNRSESFHLIEGLVEVIIFGQAGNIVEVIPMKDYSSAANFYYRISKSCYHTLLIKSEFLVFHETINGPFKKADTIFAPWAPEEDDAAAVKKFMQRLTKKSRGLAKARLK